MLLRGSSCCSSSVSVKFSKGPTSSPSSSPFSSSPVTNYLCFSHQECVIQPAVFNTRQYENTVRVALCVCVCVVPCHPVFVCWWGSPVAAVVSQRAERWLYEPTRTVPGEDRTKTLKKKKKEGGIWWRREQRWRIFSFTAVVWNLEPTRIYWYTCKVHRRLWH